MSTQIAPEALPLQIDSPNPTTGLVVLGVGGFGTAVLDRTNFRCAGKLEEHGIFPATIDKDRGLPGETDGRHFTLPRQGDSFFGSDAQLIPEMQRIAAGGKSRFALTPAEARAFAESNLEGKAGFGGQPLPSGVCAHLSFPFWRGRFERLIVKARALTPPSQDVTVVLVASLYGGTGIGHLPVLVDELLQMPEKVDVVVILGMPSHAAAVLPADQRPGAIARGIATYRELQMKKISQLILLGEDNPRMGNQRTSAIEVASILIDGWAQNGEAFDARRANWLGQDLDGAGHGQRNCSVGGAQLLIPAAVYAREDAHGVAVDVLNRMLEITAAEQARATQDGKAFVLADDLLKQLVGVVDAAGPISPLAALGPRSGSTYAGLWDAAMAVDGGDPQALDSIHNQLHAQPAKLSRQEFISVARAFHNHALAHEGTTLQDVLFHHKRLILAKVAEEFDTQFGRTDGLPMSTTPSLFPRMEEFMGAAAALCRNAADRLESDYTAQAGADHGPLHDAREARDRAADALASDIKLRGLFSKGPEGATLTYLSQDESVLQIERHGQALRLLIAHLRDLANLMSRSLNSVKADMAALRTYRTQAMAAAEAEAAEITRLDVAAPVRVAPAAGPARSDMRKVIAHHAAGNEDVREKVLGGLLVRHHHDDSDPGAWTTTWQVPLAVSGLAAGSTISSVVSKATGLRSAGQKLESFPAATLSLMAHREIAPHYERFTVFDALALEYRHESEGSGGQVEVTLLEQWLRAQVEDLRELAKPMTSPLDSSPDGTESMPPQHHQVVRMGLKPPSLDIQAAAHGDIPRRIFEILVPLLGESVADGAAHQVLLLNVVNRIDVSRLSELHGRQMMDYLLHSGTPVHLSRAVRRAWELERTAHQHGRLRDRILDPRAVELLGDLDVIGAFLALIATETMPTNEGSALHRGTSVYRLNINLGRPLVSAGVPSWHELGPSSSVVQCLDELYHGRESDLLKPAIVATWAPEYEKLKANYGEGLREYLQEALSAMQMHTTDASDRRLVDDLKLIATMLPQTSLSM